ncbi:MAG TPA: PrgI family protein [Candidatus Paceibacterota bacterium]|nr:PrgI family protein [Candidatus Paceibacterota bacterium]
MQFQVPQFIEVEDKIFGPLTFRQFVYLGGGAGLSYIIFRVLPLLIAFPLIAGVLGLTLAMAFLQYNGRPFILAMENAFFFIIHPHLYLWNNERKPAANQVKRGVVPAGKTSEVYVPRLSESKLHELAWSLDIKERIAEGSADNDDRARYDAMKPIKTLRDALPRS